MLTALATQPAALLSRLPESERRFLIEKSSEVIAKAQAGSLESLLNETAAVFSEKDYGWEEAILDGLWLRWPSEIKSQIFCSENALKNYLLLRTMRLPAQYAVVHNCQNTGMPHDVVLVPINCGVVFVPINGCSPSEIKELGIKELSHILVDWENAYPSVVGDKEIITVEKNRVNPPSFNIQKIAMGRLEFLTEQEVIDRAYAARSGRSFMDSITCGQHLFTRKAEEGSLTAFFKYYPERQAAEFLFVFQPLIGLPFYKTRVLTARDGIVQLSFEAGIARDLNNGLNFEKVPLASRESGNPGVAVKDSELALPKSEMHEFVLQLLYQSSLKRRNSYLFTKKDRSRLGLRNLQALAESIGSKNHNLEQVARSYYLRIISSSALYSTPEVMRRRSTFLQELAESKSGKKEVFRSAFSNALEMVEHLRSTNPSVGERFADYLTACVVFENGSKSGKWSYKQLDKIMANTDFGGNDTLASMWHIKDARASTKVLYFLTINLNNLGWVQLSKGLNAFDNESLVVQKLGKELLKRVGAHYSGEPAQQVFATS